MARRTRDDWLRLFEAQVESGQSAAEFCRRRGIDPGYFSQRKRHFDWQPERQSDGPAADRSGFVEVKVASGQSTLELQWGAVRLSLPAGASASWVAALMRELGDAPVQ